MTDKISACGLDCGDCPAWRVTQRDEPDLRIRTAAEWSRVFGADIQPEDIYCDGCLSEGDNLFGHCRECRVRACVLEKELSNCAACDDYPCPKLDFIHSAAPEAKERLDRLFQD